MATVLVTGAAGFIGSHVVRVLVARGDTVHAIVHSERDLSRLEPVRNAVKIHVADLADAEAVAALMAEVRPEHVFHLAASNIASGKHAGANDVVRTNVLGTAALLASLGDARSCVTMGSFLEYGAKDHALAESELCEPPELYSITKLAGTLLAQAAARAEGKPVVALRLFTPYGPQIQKGRLVYEAIRKALAGEPLTLTRPTVTRDFVYIDDIVSLCLEASERAAEYKGQIFNLGSGNKTALSELADIVLAATRSSSAVEWGGFQQVAYDADTWQADMSKTFDAFSWRPMVSLPEGISRTVEWLRESSGA